MRRLDLTRGLLGTMLTALCWVCGSAASVRAADLQLALPTLVAAPGGTVVIHLDVAPAIDSFGVLAMDFSMPLDPAVIQSSAVLSDGFLHFWGPAFTNGTNSVVAGAAAGLTPVTSTSTRMSSVHLTLKPNAVPGTVMPLTFTALRFNEGSPSVSVTPGSLTVSAGVDVPFSGPVAAMTLESPHPNPAHGVLWSRITLARPAVVRVSLHDVSGRCVRELVTGEHPAGSHAFSWNGRDDRGGELPAGLYLLRAAGAERVQVCRVVWMR